MTRDRTPRRRAAAALVVAAVLLAPGPAFAYIDPATSGIVMQLAAPLLIAAGVLRNKIKLAATMLWQRLASLWRKRRDDD